MEIDIKVNIEDPGLEVLSALSSLFELPGVATEVVEATSWTGPLISERDLEVYVASQKAARTIPAYP